MFAEKGSLLAELQEGRARGVLTFGGQDPEWREGLLRTLAGRPEVEHWCREVLAAFNDRICTDPSLAPSLALMEPAPSRWLDEVDGDPGQDRTPWHQAPSVCLPGTALAELAAARALEPSGLAPGRGIDLVAGHSSGLIVAWLVARHGATPSVDAAVDVLLVLAVSGDVAATHPWARSPRGDASLGPMVAVRGVTEPALRSLLDVHAQGSGGGPDIRIALQNAWDRFVVCGPPDRLAAWERSVAEHPTLRTEALRSHAPFHHDAVAPIAAEVLASAQAAGVRCNGPLQAPLLDPAEPVDPATAPPTGTGWYDDALEPLVRSMLVRPVRWADSVAFAAEAAGGAVPLVVVDAGPSVAVARMTERSLRGRGVHVLALGAHDDVRALTLAGERPPEPLRYRDFAPSVRTTSDGVRRIVTRHTRWSGRSPLVLAGMTPTTVDVGIVAAAANAGHVAELAGGGQTSAAILNERLDELTECLDEGIEVVFNALHLDPYLWDLHLGRQRGVQRARAEGAPICGVTVSAGIPDRDDAVRLLDELNEAGMWLNAFKPGDAASVERVLAIADATGHRVWLHLEGGLAGGHHGWSDLEQVLIATYHDIRSRPNVALVVGGGVGTADRVRALLDGSWARRHAGLDMPVDGVLVGTVAMATAESTASRPVKQALAATAGAPGAVAAGERRGGVTSGRSGLGADIHYLDNHASRVAALLDEVAGDAGAIAERHDEIAEALAGTAKPWFGEVTHMTYAQALARFVELCALGRGGRYEDGAWLDVTHRQLFAALLHRWEARCSDADEGDVTSIYSGLDDLDDPTKAVERFVLAYPIAEHAEVEPTDAAHLLGLCDRPGKPVPFVAAIDGEVRRRYLADSLWYAHDDRWNAEQVLVIPGPVAVAGITEVDEPVAELLARLSHDALDRIDVAAPPEPSCVEVVASLPSVHTSVGASIASPVRRMGAGATWERVERDGRVEARCRVGDETLTLRGPCTPTGPVEVQLTWPALAGLDADGSCSFRIDVLQRADVPIALLNERSLQDCQRHLMDVVVTGAIRARQGAGGSRPRVRSGDAGMTGVWPEVFGLLESAGGADALVRLVHAGHRTTVVDAQRLSDATITARQGEAGRELRTDVTVDGVRHRDVFLVRRAPGDPAAEPADPAAPASSSEDDQLPVVETPRRVFARRTHRAPGRSDAFAALTGDANPLHRSDLVARLAGLDGRIVHGMWTSEAARATVVEDVLDGRADRLVDWDLRFLDVVAPGVDVAVEVTRSGAVGGRLRLDVDVRCGDRTVAAGTALIAAPTTAYVFPGQGIQQRGMGAAARGRSQAAAEVWAAAEDLCRRELGFSLIEVVDANPTELEVRGPGGATVHRHPSGVLHLTQFTQVAMATLAASQVAELREAGVFDETAVLAGHSVGEYNALAAIGGVLPLEAVLRLVWARGSAMHDLVPRDAEGASGYRLAAIRPHLAGLDADAAFGLVDAVAAETGELCEVVNHNLRHRQYAVAGTTRALEELQRRLGPGATPGRAPYLEVPGIDVPFHSRALAPGVAAFREHLDRALPEEVDPARLVGRYVPNLHPEPFSLSRAYVEAVQRACGGQACVDLLDRWDDHEQRPGRLARELLVELLAWQFASPVRWIETTDVLLGEGGLGVERVVEVGVGAAPTLTNLTKAAVAAEGWSCQVLHVDLDELEVFQRDEPVEEVVPDPTPTDEDDAPGGPSTRAEDARADSSRTESARDGRPEDAPVALADAVRALLCFSAGVRLDQLGDDSIEQLVDGASSRRNQVLMDLGKELGLGSVDGAHEVPLPELLERLVPLARGHRHPGPVLAAMVDGGVAAAAGRLATSPAKLLERVTTTWGLGPGWVERCRLELALGTRDGASRRGGNLRTLSAATAEELVDEALAAVAARLGVTLARPAAEERGATLGGAAVDDLVQGVATAIGEASSAAIAALSATTGVELDAGAKVDRTADVTTTKRLAALEAEHGADRAEQVASRFDPARVQLFASSISWARADLDRLVHDPPADPCERRALVRRLARAAGADDRFDATVGWYLRADEAAGDPALRDDLGRIQAGRAPDDPALAVAGRTILISGASPGSIGERVAAALLGSGATVVALTSSMDPSRRRAWRALERGHAAPGARLFVVPANLASFRDIDAVVEWLAGSGGDAPHPGLPDVVVPFAAPSVMGDAADSGPRHEVELRVMLLGVERLVARCAEVSGERRRRVVTAVLPMSPNHGVFGGDGAYGHAKAGLEVLSARRSAESQRWGRWCRTVDVEIGWVRGTGLMGIHDHLAPVVEERLGVRTHDAEEVGRRIAALCADDGPVEAGTVHVSLTGGLDAVDPTALADLVRSGDVLEPAGAGADADSGATLRALPRPRVRAAATPTIPTPPTRKLDDMVVVCGVGEIGPWGTSSTRADAERWTELPARSVTELAVRCGLVEWSGTGGSGRWIDTATEEEVDEADLAATYRDAVTARCGIRSTPGVIDAEVQVFAERPVVVSVASGADAELVAAAHPGAVARRGDDGWTVTLPAGAALRALQQRPLPRAVTAPIPEGLSPTAFGVPAELASSIDPVAAWCLSTTAEAFLDATATPEEVIDQVGSHRIACTQGTGMGGMDSLRSLHLAPRWQLPHANDVLQEALGNVPAAHAVQSFVGATGAMIHPVAACATAAVSLELAVDLVLARKADVVVGGGLDDLGPEGIVGFAEMSATADDAELAAAGFAPREMSRPGDRSRAGFVEGQGGGTFLVCRGSVAAELGLPVRAVVVYAASHGDGLGTSIPAPGPGAFESAAAGAASPLARALEDHGLRADDIEVVSKHDTSTGANDPNEARIHERVQEALGRSPGNPLRVVSQKALTGHAKGGSALWQLAGLCDVFEDGVVPGNPNLDSVDPEVQPGPWLVVDDRPLRRRTAPRAALLTSLGFGHVSVVAALAHPEVFHRALADQRGDEVAAAHRAAVAARIRERDRRRRRTILGDDLAFRRRTPA